ncbi:MAG: esterase family protein [Candidatus Eremiobacteraeota bacterium]|nr:esterase family protein [Candidatus Eremiobacteraeota bacterium]
MNATTQSQLARLLGLHGNLHIDFLESAALANNPLRDPVRRPLVVYTPPEYDPQGSRRFPVLYCLHGYTGDAAALVSARPWETNVVQWADRLVCQTRMSAAILVIVDGFTRLGGSQYMDSIHNGAYATYTVRDVVNYVDSNYRSISAEGGRAVFGKSSGGYGSMHLVMMHPGVFAAFASHSGDTYFPTFVRSFAEAQRTLERYAGIEPFVQAFERKPKRSPSEYTAMEMLGYTAAYSPRQAKAFELDLPFDLKTGELREDVFARWLHWDPVTMCLTKRAELARLRLRYLDCGRQDEYALDLGARIFTQRVRDLGLAVRHEEFDDDHRNVGYRYEVSLPALVAALEKE